MRCRDSSSNAKRQAPADHETTPSHAVLDIGAQALHLHSRGTVYVQPPTLACRELVGCAMVDELMEKQMSVDSLEVVRFGDFKVVSGSGSGLACCC